VQNKFLSIRTASERAPEFPRNDEIERLIHEDLEKRKLDAQAELDKLRAQTDEKIREVKATQGNVRTGNGTKQGRTTDRYGNHPGENNWDQWNETH